MGTRDVHTGVQWSFFGLFTSKWKRLWLNVTLVSTVSSRKCVSLTWEAQPKWILAHRIFFSIPPWFHANLKQFPWNKSPLYFEFSLTTAPYAIRISAYILSKKCFKSSDLISPGTHSSSPWIDKGLVGCCWASPSSFVVLFGLYRTTCKTLLDVPVLERHQ